MIRYGRQHIDEDDIAAVVEALRSDYLTTGPRVEAFERAVAGFCGAAHGVAVSSGTAALHAAMAAFGVGPGHEVIVPAMTFSATAAAVVYQGATPVFADVDPQTLLLDVEDARRKITPRTRGLVAVDYAGQPCDYEALRALAEPAGLFVAADACHALGAARNGRPVGALAQATVLSFHPVKHITTGEGGMLLTDDPALAASARRFRNHGIDVGPAERERCGQWFYAVQELGYNYRITDIQCALGLAQLRKLPAFLARRRAIAAAYDQAFARHGAVRPLAVVPGVDHAYHLYVVFLDFSLPGRDRAAVFRELAARGVGANVHYIPAHLHPLYRQRFGTGPGLCPAAEAAYERILTLPLHPGMSDADVDAVVRAVLEVAGAA